MKCEADVSGIDNMTRANAVMMILEQHFLAAFLLFDFVRVIVTCIIQSDTH